jgi:hypothetical protein
MALTYQQRNATSEQAALAPLPPGALVYTPGKPQFGDLANSILGNVGTSGDGFDSLFLAVASTIDTDITALASLDALLSGLDFVAGALDAAILAPVATQYASASATGAALLRGVDAAMGLAVANPTTPKNPEPPPSPGREPKPAYPGCTSIWQRGGWWVKCPDRATT